MPPSDLDFNMLSLISAFYGNIDSFKKYNGFFLEKPVPSRERNVVTSYSKQCTLLQKILVRNAIAFLGISF